MEVSSCSGLPGIISCLYVPFYFDPHNFMRGVRFVFFSVIFPDLAFCSFGLSCRSVFRFVFRWLVTCIGAPVVVPLLCVREVFPVILSFWVGELEVTRRGRGARLIPYAYWCPCCLSCVMFPEGVSCYTFFFGVGELEVTRRGGGAWLIRYKYWRSCCLSCVLFPEGVSCYTFFLGWGAGGYEEWARARFVLYTYWSSCCLSCVMFPEGVSCYTFFLGWGAGSYEAWASGAGHTLHVLVFLLSFLCYVSGRCFLLYFLFGLGGWQL